MRISPAIFTTKFLYRNSCVSYYDIRYTAVNHEAVYTRCRCEVCTCTITHCTMFTQKCSNVSVDS